MNRKKEIIGKLIELQNLIDGLEGDEGTLEQQIEWQESRLVLLKEKKKLEG